MTKKKTKVYQLATNRSKAAHAIVRIAKEMNLKLMYRCNKEQHKVEFKLSADDEQYKIFINQMKVEAQ